MKKGETLWERDVVTTVKMKRLSDSEIAGYLATNDWQGKAGGYAIQGPAGALHTLDTRFVYGRCWLATQ